MVANFDPAVKMPPMNEKLRHMAAVSELPDEQFNKSSIDETNLTVASGLPGVDKPVALRCLAKLEKWTQLVDANTRHWMPDFKSNPAEFNHSIAQFKMLCLVTMLQKHLGVTYNLAFSQGDYDGRDPRNLFIHGLLSGFGGTCVTMPVLYIAIGRRLGYPLYLCRASEHFFVRWEGEGERFNIEATSQGFEPFDDEYMIQGPPALTEKELASGSCMRNLTRREEAAVFLSQRANCLMDHLHILEAMQTLAVAELFAPRDPCICGQWCESEILWYSFELQNERSKSQGRKNFMLAEVEVPSSYKFLTEKELGWARENLARMKRMRPNARIQWKND